MLAEALKGIAFNPYDGDPDLSATDPFHQRLLRIGVSTGVRAALNLGIQSDPFALHFRLTKVLLP